MRSTPGPEISEETRQARIFPDNRTSLLNRHIETRSLIPSRFYRSEITLGILIMGNDGGR